jgi:hypothetical protein
MRETWAFFQATRQVHSMDLVVGSLVHSHIEASLKSREQVHCAARAHLANIEEEALIIKKEEDAWSSISGVHPCAQHLRS